LQNKHFDGEDNPNKGQFYQYPHEFPGHWLPLLYLPDAIRDAVYYVPGDNKNEQAYAAYWKNPRQTQISCAAPACGIWPARDGNEGRGRGRVWNKRNKYCYFSIVR